MTNLTSPEAKQLQRLEMRVVRLINNVNTFVSAEEWTKLEELRALVGMQWDANCDKWVELDEEED